MTLEQPRGQQSDGEDRPARKSWPRPRLLSRVSIQSKLMVMLLACSILSVAVIGVIVYYTGGHAIRTAAIDRLVELRESQKRAVEALFGDLGDALIVNSRGNSAVEAMAAFSAGFDQLANATVDPAQQQAIVTYYSHELIEPTKRMTGDELDINALLPTSNAQKYLQANYTARDTFDGDSKRVADAGDGSAWSAANARFDNHFQEIVTHFEYRDALLLDLRGNVVYSAKKGPDLGTNILTGPYRESKLRDAYQKALGSNSVDFVWITDFQPYQPQLNRPTAWLVSPVGADGRIDGVLALPLPSSKINRIMTADKHWESSGMGTTTETYLVGPDGLMRSDSRLFLEDPKKFEHEAVASGAPPDAVKRAIQLGTNTLIQPAETAGWRAAQRGQSGTLATSDYLGNRELEAYAPLNVQNSELRWSILATRDTAEALARVAAFTKTLVIATTLIIFVICIAAMVLAQILVRPIRRLEAGTQRISGGDYDVNIPVTSRDEIGDLTAAFNEMSRNLAIKEQLLAEQRRENDRLLLSLMPETVVHRYRQGEETIAEEHQDVSVIFANLVGFEDLSRDLPGDELVRIVDELVRQFDSAAESLGVERVRTLHNGYLASCGVTVPRLDSVHRTVEFALEMRQIVSRFSSQTGHNLALRAGITTGKVVSGLVGRSSLTYDVWGTAASLAYEMHVGSPQPGIYVTAQVYELLRETRQFTAGGSIMVGGSEEPIWRLSERA